MLAEPPLVDHVWESGAVLLGESDESVPLEERRCSQSTEEATVNPACCTAKSAASRAPLRLWTVPGRGSSFLARCYHWWYCGVNDHGVQTRKVQSVLFYAEYK